ncbi:hypothetical protein [Knoellia subterranea]|uniref:hypothetical protein n=1 Tax=Knoellia subterranea TaxID=184882 RepID=UPI000B2B57FA|nr:hypothetical protein [Knoellia subterranea]
MRFAVGRRVSGYAACALAAATLLSGCGSGGGQTPQETSTWSTSTAPPETPSTTPTSPAGGTTPSMPSSGRARPVVMSGRVTEVREGCIVFKNDRDATRWVLIGETDGLRAKTAYVIQGVAMDAMDPNCSEGLPFQVKDAEARTEDRPVPLPSGTAADLMTLTGVLADGVESGCRLLRTDGETFVLSGNVTQENGTRVTVTGRIAENVMSFCMQGRHFAIESIRPAN